MKANHYILTALLSAAVLPALAQDLNPTVEVTNIFDGKLLEIHKPAQEMALPDSLTQFDLRFDYSVFDNPYRGVYAFKPYVVDMTPQPDAYDARTLYVRAGAGYALHPTFDLIWTPFHQKAFTMNVYAQHHSYIGNYRRLFVTRRAADTKAPLFLLSNHEKAVETTPDPDYQGYDLCTRVGANGLLEWGEGAFTFDAGYYGLNTSLYEKSNYNAADLRLGVKSKDLGSNYMYYDANLAYRFGADDIAFAGEGFQTLRAHDIVLRGTFGPVIGSHNRLLVDAALGLSVYGGMLNSSAGNFNITPRYVLNLSGVNLSLGVKISMSMADDDVYQGYPLKPSKGQFLYPEVHADFVLWQNYIDLYADVTGGDTIYGYSVQKDANHFFHPRMGRGAGPFCDLTAERVNARLGLRGNITPKFRYDLSGGWKLVKNGRVENVFFGKMRTGNLPSDLMPGVGYADYQMAFADLKAVWDAKPFLVEGVLSYRWTDLYKKEKPGFGPAPFTAMVRGTYNWNDRIIGGLRVEGASARAGIVNPLPALSYSAVAVRVPGWVDLGVFGEFVVTRRLSFWLETGNLLNMTIQRIPMYTESGLTVTAGLTFTL